MCSASTAEFVEANKKVWGFTVGSLSINTMILVNDVCNVNSDILDVILSHNNLLTFGKLKRQPLSGPKCFLLPVNNTRDKWKLPILKVGNHAMEVRDMILYLGNVFNSKGTNKDLIDHRIKNARTCMINSIAMCSDVTLGRYLLLSLLLVYKCVFLATLLYGAQTWTNLSGEDLKRLHVIQMQFLKRILQVPSSTSNCLVCFELGILPVEYEIHARKLVFLYHILSLETDDPVYQMYESLGKYTMEKNWANECSLLRERYGLDEKDSDIKQMDKEEWKKKVKSKIREKAVSDLTKKMESLSKANGYPIPTDLRIQQYFLELDSTCARLLFQVRCKVLDIRVWKKFRNNDLTCRLCENNEETIEHVLWGCCMVPGQYEPMDVYSGDVEVVKVIVQRIKDFQHRLQVKRSTDEENNDALQCVETEQER